jgi:hypothetical protein
MPPEHMQHPGLGFSRAEALEDFTQRQFLDRSGLFFDPEHGHLTNVFIGILWASSTHVDKGSVKAGTAQLVKRSEPTKWSEAVQQVFLHQMFGATTLPIFRITLHAPTWFAYNDRQRFALLDHELSHCGHAKGAFGEPRFSSTTGQPVWCTNPHDSETFVGTTERWGAEASGSAGIVRAALKPPRFAWVPGSDLNISAVCGNT